MYTMGESPSSLSANTTPFKGSNRAPSFGCLIGDRCYSEYASSISSVDAPPSFTDMAHEVASRSSFDQNLDEVEFEEVITSLTLHGPEDDWEAHRSDILPPRSVVCLFENWHKDEYLGSGSMGPGYNEDGFFFGVKEVSPSPLDQSGQRVGQLKKQKIMVKVTVNNKKYRKALHIAVSLSGVESASLVGSNKDLIVVTGEGIDSVKLMSLLRKGVGHTELVSIGPVEWEKKPKAKESKATMEVNPYWYYYYYCGTPYYVY